MIVCTTCCPFFSTRPPAINQPTSHWSLEDWLRWQENLHPRSIDMGLARVAEVWRRLGLSPGSAKVITIAGTNGKGSCARTCESLALANGWNVGCYTSPHLWRYNERIRIGGRPVSDQALIGAFDRINRARGDISLSFFEFGTLAALVLFADQALDLWVLEVGLGGRLDAVNIVDADVAVLTSLGRDHAEYLGTDPVQIAREKLAVGRANKPLLRACDVPPEALQETAARGCRLHDVREQFALQRDGALTTTTWPWLNGATVPAGLIAGNLLLGVAALTQLAMIRDAQATANAFRALRVPGRCEHREYRGLDLVLDVAHNAEAALHLAEYLRSLGDGLPTRMIFAALADKPIEEMTALLDPLCDEWLLVALDVPRALPPEQLLARVSGVKPRRLCASVGDALAQVESGRAVIWGSFYTVAAFHG